MREWRQVVWQFFSILDQNLSVHYVYAHYSLASLISQYYQDGEEFIEVCQIQVLTFERLKISVCMLHLVSEIASLGQLKIPGLYVGWTITSIIEDCIWPLQENNIRRQTKREVKNRSDAKQTRVGCLGSLKRWWRQFDLLRSNQDEIDKDQSVKTTTKKWSKVKVNRRNHYFERRSITRNI